MRRLGDGGQVGGSCRILGSGFSLARRKRERKVERERERERERGEITGSRMYLAIALTTSSDGYVRACMLMSIKVEAHD
jgi:hypothetical protein